jgi:hypothetical protein
MHQGSAARGRALYVSTVRCSAELGVGWNSKLARVAHFLDGSTVTFLVLKTLIKGPTPGGGKPIMPPQMQRRNVQFDLWNARG